MSKQEWKKILNDTVHSHIEAMWRADIGEKSSLKYVNPNFLKVGKSHHVWSTVRNCLTDNKRAELKCKLLTGTYILQCNRAAFNQYTIGPVKLVPRYHQKYRAGTSQFTIFALSAGFLLTKINIGKTGNQNPPQGG